LASHLAWKKDEITFSNARFALEHASGQGQAVLALQSPRPHIRAALALDSLDLNPFLSTAKADSPADKPKSQSAEPSEPPAAENAVSRPAPLAEAAPQGVEGTQGAEASPPATEAASQPPAAEAPAATPDAAVSHPRRSPRPPPSTPMSISTCARRAWRTSSSGQARSGSLSVTAC
jgi:AsmA protein